MPIRYHKDPFPGDRMLTPTPASPLWGRHLFSQNPTPALYSGSKDEAGDLLPLIVLHGNADVNGGLYWEVDVRAHVNDHLLPNSGFMDRFDEQTYDDLETALSTLQDEYESCYVNYGYEPMSRRREQTRQAMQEAYDKLVRNR